MLSFNHNGFLNPKALVNGVYKFYILKDRIFYQITIKNLYSKSKIMLEYELYTLLILLFHLIGFTLAEDSRGDDLILSY